MVETDLVGDFGNGASLLAQQLGSAFQADAADKIAGAQTQQAAQLTVEVFPAHGHAAGKLIGGQSPRRHGVHQYRQCVFNF